MILLLLWSALKGNAKLYIKPQSKEKKFKLISQIDYFNIHHLFFSTHFSVLLKKETLSLQQRCTMECHKESALCMHSAVARTSFLYEINVFFQNSCLEFSYISDFNYYWNHTQKWEKKQRIKIHIFFGNESNVRGNEALFCFCLISVLTFLFYLCQRE